MVTIAANGNRLHLFCFLGDLADGSSGPYDCILALTVFIRVRWVMVNPVENTKLILNYLNFRAL